LHRPGGLAHRLDDQRDGAPVAVVVGDGQRDALAVLVVHDDDELPGPCRAGHHRLLEFKQASDVGEVLTVNDTVG
jgi:hypothetical protein